MLRPQTGYYQDSISEAAAPFESLVQIHPFLDGNQRNAVAAADVHLRMNGLDLGGKSMGHVEYIIGLPETGDLDLTAIDVRLPRCTEAARNR